MAERFKTLQDDHIAFIAQQYLFFVGTAGAEGHINVSPKGMDSFRVIAPDRIAWLNLTGSGNETATHVQENGRMTILFCSFDKQPLILRLYGHAQVLHARDQRWPEMAALFPEYTGARQIFDMHLDLVQTSCGFGVPFYEWKGGRDTLLKWADKNGRAGIEAYWDKKNRVSLDGKDTGILIDE